MPENEQQQQGTASTVLADRVGALLDRVSGYLGAERFDRISDGVTVAGHWALLAVAVLGLLIELTGIPSHGVSALVRGIGWLIALPLLQYVAVQFMGATRSMVTTNSTSLGSQAFLRSYALVALVGAIADVVGALAQGIEAGSPRLFLFGLGMAALWLATAWLALNPGLLGIRINRQSGAGEEAIGVLSFFAKSAVRIVPIFYGVTLVVAAIEAVLTLGGMIGASSTARMLAITRAEFFAPTVIGAVLSPLLAYIGFLLFFLVIDLMRGILGIPGAMQGGGARSGRSGGTSSRKKAASRKKTASSGSGQGGSAGA